MAADTRALTVRCGEGAIELLDLQRPGRQAMPAAALRAGSGARRPPLRRFAGRERPLSDRGERGGKGEAAGGGRRPTPRAVAVRVGAVRVIERMLDGEGSLTRLLPAAQASLPASERALLQAYVFGLARWSGQLEALLGTPARASAEGA